jgi:hypothetical protein
MGECHDGGPGQPGEVAKRHLHERPGLAAVVLGAAEHIRQGVDNDQSRAVIGPDPQQLVEQRG